MLSAVEERLRELQEADSEVRDEIEHERDLYSDVMLRIEREKQEFLQDLREEFEDENREKLADLTEIEEDVSRDAHQVNMLKDLIVETKNGFASQLKSVAEKTTAEEQRVYRELENEVQQELSQIQNETQEMKQIESEQRRKLTLANTKLEETRINASKVVLSFRNQLAEIRSQLRDTITQEKSLEQQFSKREQQYNSLYDTIEREEQEIQRSITGLQTSLAEMIEGQNQEGELIHEHIETGKQRLEKIIYAIGEFKQENAKLREKNERALSNLKSGLDGLIKGIIPE
jgi:chromosome segregation ATPase